MEEAFVTSGTFVYFAVLHIPGLPKNIQFESRGFALSESYEV